MQKHLLIYFLLLSTFISAQQENVVLNFKEYLGYVKKYHPIAKQAELLVSNGEANLMKSRGGFDPNIQVDYDRKEFKGIEYYDLLNATFKIPTWYGVEFKAGFEQNDGVFLNSQNSVPDDGLFNAGVSVSLGKGLWINERMATLQKAKVFKKQTNLDRDILVNKILYQAAVSYFDWLKAYNEREIFSNFVDNAKTRFEGVKRSALAGDKAMIDTVEARIAYQSRVLSWEQAKVKFVKKSLQLSNFLWLEGNVPVELQPNVVPDQLIEEDIVDKTLQISDTSLDSFVLENHPKLRAIDYKIRGLEIDKKLKANMLLPQIDLEYNFLTETPDVGSSFRTQEYKGGLTFKLPLFLRKERGDLKLAKYKIQDAEFEKQSTQLQIRNKVMALYTELESFKTQNQLISNIVADYTKLLTGEERKFNFGESSLFLINTREKSLIDAKLKQVEVQNKFLNSKIKLFNSLAINPDSL